MAESALVLVVPLVSETEGVLCLTEQEVMSCEPLPKSEFLMHLPMGKKVHESASVA